MQIKSIMMTIVLILALSTFTFSQENIFEDLDTYHLGDTYTSLPVPPQLPSTENYLASFDMVSLENIELSFDSYQIDSESSVYINDHFIGYVCHKLFSRPITQ